MGKWLAALGAIILVVLILMWRQLDSSSAAPPPAERPKPADPVASVPSTPDEKPAEKKPVEPAGPPPSVVMTKPAEGGEKWDPQSDEFFHKHDGYFGVEGEDNLFVKTHQGARLTVVKNFVTTIQYDLDYDASPSPGRKATDRTFALTFGYRF